MFNTITNNLHCLQIISFVIILIKTQRENHGEEICPLILLMLSSERKPASYVVRTPLTASLLNNSNTLLKNIFRINVYI